MKESTKAWLQECVNAFMANYGFAMTPEQAHERIGMVEESFQSVLDILGEDDNASVVDIDINEEGITVYFTEHPEDEGWLLDRVWNFA